MREFKRWLRLRHYIRTMKRNSMIWHKTTDRVERARLHDANFLIAIDIEYLYGITTSFDTESGTWELHCKLS